MTRLRSSVIPWPRFLNSQVVSGRSLTRSRCSIIRRSSVSFFLGSGSADAEIWPKSGCHPILRCVNCCGFATEMLFLSRGRCFHRPHGDNFQTNSRRWRLTARDVCWPVPRPEVSGVSVVEIHQQSDLFTSDVHRHSGIEPKSAGFHLPGTAGCVPFGCDISCC